MDTFALQKCHKKNEVDRKSRSGDSMNEECSGLLHVSVLLPFFSNRFEACFEGRVSFPYLVKLRKSNLQK